MENKDKIEATITDKSESLPQNETDWSIIEESESNAKDATNVSNESMFSFGNLSQNIIVSTINNKLSDITTKMDLILNKLETLEKKVDSLELQTGYNRLNSDYESSLIFNNEDIRNILNLDNYQINDQLTTNTNSNAQEGQNLNTQYIPNSTPNTGNFYSNIMNSESNRFTNTNTNFSPNLFRVNSTPSLNSTFTSSMFNTNNFFSRNNTTNNLNTNTTLNMPPENNTSTQNNR